MYRFYNANPKAARVSDCTVRAISALTGKPWQTVYMDLCLEGLKRADMPSANHVWGAYLKKLGYKRYALPNSCPDCYTVEDFAQEHRSGRYLLALSGHVVAVIDGDWLDTWDSGQETTIYYWMKE